MLTRVNLASVEAMADGTISAAFDSHMARAVLDCEDRPGDNKPRKVVLEMEVKPVMLQGGSVTEVVIEAKVKCTIPAHVSRPIECKIKDGGKAVFNDLSQSNVNQKTIDQA